MRGKIKGKCKSAAVPFGKRGEDYGGVGAFSDDLILNGFVENIRKKWDNQSSLGFANLF